MATPVSDPTTELVEACTESRLEADLGWAIGSVFRSYLKSARASVADLPGGPRGYQVLSAAGNEQPTTQQALGQRVGIDRSVMTGLVDDLAAAGLVERRPDPTDRRARHIALTEVGRTKLAELDERIGMVEQHILGVLEPADRDTFRTLLFRIAAQADALDPANSACAVAEDVAKLSS